MKSAMDYMLFPPNQEVLITEIKNAFEDYNQGKLHNVELINLIRTYKNQKLLGEEKLSNAYYQFEIFPTIQTRLGKKKSSQLQEIIKMTY